MPPSEAATSPHRVRVRLRLLLNEVSTSVFLWQDCVIWDVGGIGINICCITLPIRWLLNNYMHCSKEPLIDGFFKCNHWFLDWTYIGLLNCDHFRTTWAVWNRRIKYFTQKIDDDNLINWHLPNFFLVTICLFYFYKISLLWNKIVYMETIRNVLSLEWSIKFQGQVL